MMSPRLYLQTHSFRIAGCCLRETGPYYGGGTKGLVLAGLFGGLEGYGQSLQAEQERAVALRRDALLRQSEQLLANAVRASAVADEFARERREASLRLFQRKTYEVIATYVDSLDLYGVALTTATTEALAVAKDIFVARPDASEAIIREDLRPVFAAYARRRAVFVGVVGGWARANQTALLDFSELGRSRLIEAAMAVEDAYVAGSTSGSTTAPLDAALRALTENRALCRRGFMAPCQTSLLSEAARNELAVLHTQAAASRARRLPMLQQRRQQALRSVDSLAAVEAITMASWNAAEREAFRVGAKARLAALDLEDSLAVEIWVHRWAAETDSNRTECLQGIRCDKGRVSTGTYATFDSVVATRRTAEARAADATRIARELEAKHPSVFRIPTSVLGTARFQPRTVSFNSGTAGKVTTGAHARVVAREEVVEGERAFVIDWRFYTGGNSAAEILGRRLGHNDINTQLMAAGAPGEPPGVARTEKVRQWLVTTNADPDCDPLRVLGKFLRPHFDANPDKPYGTLPDEAQESIQTTLGEHGLRYVRGGTIVGGVIPASRTLEAQLSARDLPALDAEFTRAMETIDHKPREAVSAASNILETLCKLVIAGTPGAVLPTKQDLPALFAETRKHLRLDPASVEDEDVKRILSGLINTVTGVRTLRTHASAAHGIGAAPYLLEPRHARLAVSAAHAAAAFVLETWNPPTPPNTSQPFWIRR